LSEFKVIAVKANEIGVLGSKEMTAADQCSSLVSNDK
jgi:hypothetical protein